MKRILVVEDDPDLREAMKMLLEDHDFLVECAANGKEGFEILRAATELPNLILLDLMMPVMNGWQFIEEVKRDPRDARANVPIVVTTAAYDISDPTLRKVQAVLRKPVDLNRLLGCIEVHCPRPRIA